MGFDDELRLAYAVALNVIVLLAAYRFARRRLGGDGVRRVIDAGLIYYLLQYVVVGGLGLVGLLSPWTIGPLALMLCALLWVGSGWRRDEKPSLDASPDALSPPLLKTTPTAAPLLDRAVLIACTAFLVAYTAAFVHQQRPLPPTADDALTYHLPAAVQWLQTGRIGVFPTWFFNPANAYSPLGGSIFMAWLIAPVGSDVLARYAQVGPLLLLFFAIVEIARLLGASGATAALVALACVMTRSFVNQVIVPKDDLFLTAFCVAAVLALAPQRAGERWAPWRVGTSLGLMLAVKYTATFSLPILLLMVDVPLRHARWRRGGGVLVALACAAALAGPWYLRNAALTGNPLFPVGARVGGVHVLDGLFSTTRSATLETPGGVFDTLTGGRGYYGPPTAVVAALVVAWAAALVLVARRGALRDPLWRACLLGTVLSIVAFALAAPYAEVRFISPALALLFGVAGGAAARIPRRGDVAAAAALALIVLGEALYNRPDVQGFVVAGFIVAGAITAVCALIPPLPRHGRRLRAAVAVLGGVVLAGYAFVNWRAYLTSYAAGRIDGWAAVRGDIARAWGVIERDVPPGSVVAYANTHYVYPLQGLHLRNRVVYAPSRPGVRTQADLPPAPTPLAGEQIADHFTAELQASADARTWRANLVTTGADFLVVGKSAASPPPPELAFVAERPGAFELLHDGPTATIYRVRDPGLLAD